MDASGKGRAETIVSRLFSSEGGDASKIKSTNVRVEQIRIVSDPKFVTETRCFSSVMVRADPSRNGHVF